MESSERPRPSGVTLRIRSVPITASRSRLRKEARRRDARRSIKAKNGRGGISRSYHYIPHIIVPCLMVVQVSLIFEIFDDYSGILFGGLSITLERDLRINGRFIGIVHTGEAHRLFFLPSPAGFW